MYAIVKTGSKQYWITPGQTITVEKIDAKEGQEVMLEAIWSAGDNPDTNQTVDSNSLPKAKVTAKILRHVRAPKVLVFKKKPKLGYKKTIGHRQNMTEILIDKIQLQ
jgi:large subunit ribosomal protein L21